MKKIWILWTFLIISMLLTFMLGSCGASSGTDETGPGADLPESLGSESQGSESTDASGIIENVNLKIRALPDPYALTKADYPAVEEALEAYKALTDSQRASVEAALVEKLRSLEAKMSEPDVKRTVHVTDAPYGAVGDGRTDDRPAIQSAIDDMAQNGGGIVLLDAGKTFVSGNLWLKSHVELRFEDGAKLKQSADPDAYVELQEDGTYAPFQMTYGHVIYPEREWDVGSCYNYPFLFARDIEDFKVTGNGIIEMVRGRDCSDTLHICPIVLNYADRFELSGFTVQNYNAWAINCRMSTNGLFEGITIKDATDGAADGIGIMCSQNIRVTGCHLITSDDGIKVSCTYGDPRRGPWMQEFTPIPCRNIEIDHNHCVVTWDATKAFCFFAWGSAYEDLNAVEISDVYVHDNYFKTMGVWTGNWNLKTHKFEYNGSTSPVKSIRFENNTIDLIQDNFYTLPISDVYGFACMPTLKNGDFSDGSVYWIFRDETASGVDEEGFGYIDSFDRADPAIYQGLKLLSDVTYTFSGKVRATGQGARLFVKEQASGQLIASAECTSIDFETVTLTFKVPKDGNYHIGLERGDAKEGSAAIDDASLTAEMYVDVPEGSENILSTQKPDLLTAGDGINDMFGHRFFNDRGRRDHACAHVYGCPGIRRPAGRSVGGEDREASA